MQHVSEGASSSLDYLSEHGQNPLQDISHFTQLWGLQRITALTLGD